MKRKFLFACEYKSKKCSDKKNNHITGKNEKYLQEVFIYIYEKKHRITEKNKAIESLCAKVKGEPIDCLWTSSE